MLHPNNKGYIVPIFSETVIQTPNLEANACVSLRQIWD